MPINQLTAEGFGMLSGISGGQQPFSFGNALQFDGVNDFVNFNDTYLNGKTVFTVNMWFYRENASTASRQYIFWHGNFNNYGVSLGINFDTANKLGARARNSGTEVSLITTTSIAINTWYFVSFVYDSVNDEHFLYLNGSLEDSSTVAAGSISARTAFGLGADISNPSSLNFKFEGRTDELSIGETALTLANHQSLFSSGNGALATDIFTPDRYFRFDEEDGETTLIDTMGNQNGTLNNFSRPPAYFIPHDGGFDPDAQAFIDAVGADATISEYINTMFLGMKGEGTTNGTNFYSKLRAVYPMSPSDASTISLSTIKWNAVNPLDTDAAFRLTFVNAPTADLALGLNNNATPNGYAETHFVDTDEFTAGNNGLTAFVTRRVSGNGYPIAAEATLAIRNNASNAYEARSSGQVITGSVISEGDILSQSRRSATDFESYINGVSEGNNATSASGQTLIQLYLMARFFVNPRDFLNGAVGFVAIHDGLTDQETQDLYDVINTWNTNLGR